MTEWQPIETAPRDGKRFLAALSNGWVVILSETPDWERYAWYTTDSHISVPVARTHAPGSLDDSLVATHWMPLPEAPGDNP